MRKDLYKGVVLGAIAASVVMMAGTALAGTGVGGVFNLGKTNRVNAPSVLKGATTGQSVNLIADSGTVWDVYVHDKDGVAADCYYIQVMLVALE